MLNAATPRFACGLPLLIAVCFATTCGPTLAANLVSNGDFATGDFTSWTATQSPVDNVFSASPGGIPTLQVISGFGPSGQFAAAFGGFPDPIGDTLTQTISTQSGEKYTFSFEVKEGAQGGSHFDAAWNGTNILSIGDVAPFDFTPYSFTETATGTSTTIYFDGADQNDWTHLFGVTVTHITPEPGSVVLLSLATVGLALTARRRKLASN